MEFSRLSERALEIRKHYEAFEEKQFGRSWTLEEISLGFMGDVGDLAKLILAHEGVRAIPDAREKLEHELADCLWSLMVIANKCEIDLENAFTSTMDDLERSLT